MTPPAVLNLCFSCAHALRTCTVAILGSLLYDHCMCCVQTMVRHKSRLEREKEAVEAHKESGLPSSVGQVKQRRSPAGSSFAGQVGLDCPYVCAATIL